MTRLNREQLAFFGAKQVPLSRVFDATGMQRPDYQTAMKDLDKWVAYGVTPCTKKGHTLRTRGGHCVQCDTKPLGFLIRFDAPGQVYVAKSLRPCLVKIGCSKDTERRIDLLNQWAYGGRTDWVACYWEECAAAGVVENFAQQQLSKHAKQGIYYPNGSVVRECRELFTCKPAVAIKALKHALKTFA